MDATMQERIRSLLGLTYVKRLLIRWFVQKGFVDGFDTHVYPPMMQQLIKEVPQLQGKVEIVPSMEEIDPSTGMLRVSWNLFVLGNQRLDLGSSTHKNISDIQQGQYVGNSALPSRRAATPRQIITFVLNTIKERRSCYVDIDVTSKPMEPLISPMGSSSFFQKKRPLN
ncbi:MAG: hypothetical protein Q8K86_07280 [Candidatus Nanopelagicaceae bacterium]|nr:hypothetical protein [Candidatus Nanopelagicaceae bacterium]